MRQCVGILRPSDQFGLMLRSTLSLSFETPLLILSRHPHPSRRPLRGLIRMRVIVEGRSAPQDEAQERLEAEADLITRSPDSSRHPFAARLWLMLRRPP